MFKGHVATGTVEGTGATIIVQTGFIPARVELLNQDGIATMVWTNTMPDPSGFKSVTAGTMSIATTLGIGTYAGTEGANSAGFTIGADTDVNVSAETIHWTAWGVE